MQRVAIVGLGWLGMPLALSLMARGYQVVGSKTTPDGVEAARMSGVECYPLRLAPQLECDDEDLAQLLSVDALVITLPASCGNDEGMGYRQSVRQLVDSALAYGVARIIFLSSTSVYGAARGEVNEDSPLQPNTLAGQALTDLERWLHDLPNTSVDVLRLAGLVGEGRHPGRFLAGKTDLPGGNVGVNLLHRDDAIAAIMLLLAQPQGGHVYNLCAPQHPARRAFYPPLARALGLTPPAFRSDDDATAGKAIDGTRISHELGFVYRYSDPTIMPFD
ncbi:MULTISPECIES: SDR family oxidoreductase [Edwardsiella]|uniref:NAD-dependent epimerase/dehydratase n=2 Tax=Edwardsiella anguillarum TaxID=1821960 RepID=A0A076LE44_9GAMM|nr:MULTISPECIES: SDR family oxidoreductase [Edwardsiella]AKM47448.1 hypothetical protein QY76_08980 [Edwardsiella sp. EA181011]GAJ66124.1 nucleoside-diphosphate-sugar epimerase [Edwardsiella piscicida]AIJ06770.1 NAD-dependent epimerase/dehydratase [Edwardsiella anguillarum ET080813]AKR78241.1 SDR family oxidoreductase [Edwardsiella sp. LADL05-105]KAB0593372.1 SDR family oxidoreductase [Edwardsiella anguillarum]